MKQKELKKLYLDDVRIPQTEGWEIVRNYDDFVKWIEENGLPDIVSFDHDLAEVHYDPSTWRQSFEYHEKLVMMLLNGFVNIVGETDSLYLIGMFIPQILLGAITLFRFFRTSKKS